MRFRIVRAAQSVVQECSDFRVRPFARSRIGTNMNALARIHAVGNVAALDDVAVAVTFPREVVRPGQYTLRANGADYRFTVKSD